MRLWVWTVGLAALGTVSWGDGVPCTGCTAKIGPDAVCWDPTCLKGGFTGCNAGGEGQQCRFCKDAPANAIRCNGTVPTLPPYTGTGAPPTRPTSRCSGPNALAQTKCTKAEAAAVQCPDNTYVCLKGAAMGGCSSSKWTHGSCDCACKVEPFPVYTCPWLTYIFAPCNPQVAPYFCPSTNGCAPKPFHCSDLCTLSGPAPFPPRPVSNNTFIPSSTLKSQRAVCGDGVARPGPKCAPQPNSPQWPYSTLRNAKCKQRGWWCQDGSDWDGPSKFQCGATMQNNATLCPLKKIQAKTARVAPHYSPPAWAPQLNPSAPNDYCGCSVDCDALKDAQHCVGCCTWDNPNLTCKRFSEVGKGAACTQVSPRWNWILTTCDTMGGQAFGGACQVNPFSTVDVRYIAYYQLAKDPNGNFVWQIIPDSSLNWRGDHELIDFSALPTEFTATKAGPIRSCSGGGGGWNSAIFPYHSNGATPPAFLAVMSYKRLYNAAWFVLNQRILDGGPDIPTTKSMTNCWGEISAGEIDFLETPNLFPQKFQNAQGWNVFRTTSYNAANRCFACNHGSRNGSKLLAGCGGEPAATFYDANSEMHSDHGHLWAAVIDARGTTLYKDPYWPGLSVSCAAETLVNLHPAAPAQQQPCTDPSASCGIYLPSCVTKVSPAMTQITGGDVSRIPRCYPTDWSLHTTCTNNWWNLMVDTGQWTIRDPPPYSPA